MATDNGKGGESREGPRQEFEIAYYTKELGRPLQRQMLARQLAALGEGSKAAHHAGQVGSGDRDPLPDDRAG